MTRGTRPLAVLLTTLALACDSGEPHECDAGTPTCESSLVVTVPTNSVAFTLTIDDGQGLATTIVCPDGANVVEGYVITCGASQVTIETASAFGDEVSVQLEQGVTESFTPDYQKGGDFCGNPCTIGTIDL